MAIAAADPSPAAVMTWARGVGGVAGDPDAGHRRPADPVGVHPAVVVGPAAERVEQVGVRGERGAHEDRAAGDGAAVREPYAGEPVVGDDQSLDLALDDAHRPGLELLALGRCHRSGVGEVDDVVGPLPDQQRVGHRVAGAAQHPEWLVADLVTVAVGTVEEVASPALADAGDVGEQVSQPGGDQDVAGRHDRLAAVRTGRHGQLEAAPVGRPCAGDGAADQLGAVARHLRPPGGEEVDRRHPVAGQEPLHVGGGGVARRPRVDHQHRTPGPGQDQRC